MKISDHFRLVPNKEEPFLCFQARIDFYNQQKEEQKANRAKYREKVRLQIHQNLFWEFNFEFYVINYKFHPNPE